MNKNKNRFMAITLSITLSVSLMSSYVFIRPLDVKAATSVCIDPSKQYQTIDGWGTSLAWWAGQVGGWSDTNRKAVEDLVFGDQGLGLNIMRYNIGGGDDPTHTHMHPARQMQGFESSLGNWDWSADANQRTILKEAAKYHPSTNIIEAQSNTPPYWMTVSGCASGNTDASKDNLRSDQYDNFSDYLTTVVKHFKDVEGINFQYIDPVNEPNTDYWKALGSQEGSHFDPASQQTIINKVADSLKSKGLDTKITGTDETSIDTQINTYKSFDATTKNLIDRINVHTYSGSERFALRDLAQAEGKKLYMSEYSTGYIADNHNSIAPAIPVGKQIMKDIKDMGVNAWVIWQAVEDEKENFINLSNGTAWNTAGSWGLIHGVYQDFTSPTGQKYQKEQYFISKQYYVMKQFSSFIKKGYKIIDANNDNVIAAMDPITGKVVIVATNFNTKDSNTTFDLSGFNSLGTIATPYRTSDTQSTTQLSDINISSKALSTTLPANSITTFVIDGSSYTDGTIATINDNVMGTGENQFNYLGTGWSYNNTQSGAYSSDIHYSNIKDNTYTIKFNGNKFNIYGTLSNDSGKAAVSIDNGSEIIVDCYNATRHDNALIYTSPDLKSGEHTVKARVTGDKNLLSTNSFVCVDKVEIVNGTIVSGDLTAPRITSLVGGSQRLVVNFNQVSGATSYNIKYGTASGIYTEAINNVTSSPYIIKGLQGGITYYVSVSAVVGGNETSKSNEMFETVNTLTDKPLVYYVDCGSTSVNTLPTGEDYGSFNSVVDQTYGIDASTGYVWGYTTSGAPWSSGGSDPYTSILADNGITPGKGINYTFEIPNGKYSIDLGFKDQWNNSKRFEDILINKKVVTQNYNPPNTNEIKSYKDIDVTDGSLKIDVVRSVGNTNQYTNPLISWIKVVRTSADKSTLIAAIINATTLITSKTVGITLGNVPQTAKDAFQNAITAATTVKTNTAATQAEVDAQILALGTATTNFNNTVILTRHDTATLSLAITLAQELYNMGEEETKNGNAVGLKIKLQEAITNAQSVLISATTTLQKDIDAAVTTLSAADAKLRKHYTAHQKKVRSNVTH